VTTDTVLHTI